MKFFAPASLHPSKNLQTFTVHNVARQEGEGAAPSNLGIIILLSVLLILPYSSFLFIFSFSFGVLFVLDNRLSRQIPNFLHLLVDLDWNSTG